MSRKRPETTLNPQGWVLGPSLCNILASNKDSGTELTTSKFSIKFTKTCGVADMLEGRDGTQKELSSLNKVVSNSNQMTKYSNASK